MLITPKNRVPLHLFWFIIDNQDGRVSFKDIEQVNPSYKSRIHTQMAISKLRPLFAMNGYEVRPIYGFGYECERIECTQAE